MFTIGYPMENGIGIKKRCADTDRHRDAARMWPKRLPEKLGKRKALDMAG